MDLSGREERESYFQGQWISLFLFFFPPSGEATQERMM